MTVLERNATLPMPEIATDHDAPIVRAEPKPAAVAAPEPAAITVARGDGIGPEIMDAVLRVLEAAGARLDLSEIAIGEQVYRSGVSSGIGEESWEAIRRTRVLLKAPITTPQGGGYKSLNVTLRKALGLYANVRPCASFHPYVTTKHPELDLVIVRENEEDTYGGIEHRQTREVTQCLKLITRPGCERIARYAFEYARAHGRQKVTCLTKDNIMKITDGLFRRVVEEVAAEYPDIAYEHMIIDIGTARLAAAPERFDVIVVPNLYGDILSDVAAEIAGSVGLAGSANVGEHGAMFEAIHGSAPDIAGQDVANPSGLLQAATMMLEHLGQSEVAARVRNAWLCTIEDGIHTRDVFASGRSAKCVGTRAFADAVVERLGREPMVLPRAAVAPRSMILAERPAGPVAVPAQKTLVGVDVFLDWSEEGRDPARLAAALHVAAGAPLPLTMITNRGVKVWPNGFPETFRTDHWRCRFGGVPERELAPFEVPRLLSRLVEAGFDVVKTENLYLFDGKPGFSLGQGQ